MPHLGSHDKAHPHHVTDKHAAHPHAGPVKVGIHEAHADHHHHAHKHLAHSHKKHSADAIAKDLCKSATSPALMDACCDVDSWWNSNTSHEWGDLTLSTRVVPKGIECPHTFDHPNDSVRVAIEDRFATNLCNAHPNIEICRNLRDDLTSIRHYVGNKGDKYEVPF